MERKKLGKKVRYKKRSRWGLRNILSHLGKYEEGKSKV
jgi:hypothetical protein